VDVDLHQLELRHDDLRIRGGDRRRRLIASVAELGQQVPVIVIAERDRLVLIDGYLRVEALRRLGRDTVIATAWPVTEPEALLHHRHLAASEHTAIEDAWLLARLRTHGLSLDDLAARLCRSKSWVSRRLALLDELATAAQASVRAGIVPAHAAMKYLVPLARANRRHCEQLVAGLGETRVSERDVGALYRAWRRADTTSRERIVAEPLLCLRALRAAIEPADDEAASLLKDLTTLAAIAWRTRRRVHDGGAFTADHTKAWSAAADAFASLGAAIEELHAGPDDTSKHPDLT
jgi:ParB family transcriptional regulator, chromosome partitioning protein